MTLRVVLLDVNETLSDMSPIADRFEAIGAPRHLAGTWFAGVLRDGFALAVADDFGSFADIAADVLRGLLAGLPDWPGASRKPTGHVDDAIKHVLGGFGELDVHPDIPAGLRALRDGGLRLFTMTNGAASLTEGLLTRAGLLDLIEARLDVTGPRIWKPAPDAYRYAVDYADVAVDEAALVAVHPWDVHGAQRAGLAGAWIDREGLPYPTTMGAPDEEAPDLPALAERLLARTRR